MEVKFTQAINQICDEKNLSRDIVLETVKAALASAYKKDYGSRDQEVKVDIDEETGSIKVYVIKEVVDEVEDKMLQISVVDASKIKKGAKVGDTVEILDIPADFGRIAAQTAKQVIIQRIREAERDMVFEEFKDKEGEMVNGVVQRVEGDTVIVDLGKATGVLYKSEQMAEEHYYTGQRLKIFIVRVESATRGPQIVLSRSHPDMIRKLFEMEVPEILAGTIEIKSIAREGGERTKIAVFTNTDGIDPVGALVGQRGSRVQSVMSELGDEKIDIILWDPEIKTYIVNALSPAKVVEVEINEAEKKATVKVPEDQLSLAIGKKGQNVRLAAKLTGWNVDIAGTDDAGIEKVEQAAVPETKKATEIEDAIIKNVESQVKEGEETKADEVKPGVQDESASEMVSEAESAGVTAQPKAKADLAEGQVEPEEPLQIEPTQETEADLATEAAKIKKDTRERLNDGTETPYGGESVADEALEAEEGKTPLRGQVEAENIENTEEKGQSIEEILDQEKARASSEDAGQAEEKK